VRLLGPISYGGEVVNEAFLGDPDWPADLEASHLEQALRLILVCGILALVLGLALAAGVHFRFAPGDVR
jgi:adenosylcobinamide-phosphate synthase